MDTDIYYSHKKELLGSFVNFNPGGVRIIVMWKAFPWLRAYAIANRESINSLPKFDIMPTKLQCTAAHT